MKLDSGGCLSLRRKGKMKKQFCPYVDILPDQDMLRCGDWCPNFSEPEAYDAEPGTFFITLCQGVLVSSKNFIDEREGEVTK